MAKRTSKPVKPTKPARAAKAPRRAKNKPTPSRTEPPHQAPASEPVVPLLSTDPSLDVAVADQALEISTEPPGSMTDDAAPDAEHAADQEVDEGVAAQPQTEAVESVEHAMNDVEAAAAALSQEFAASAPVLESAERRTTISQEDTAALDSILAETDHPGTAELSTEPATQGESVPEPQATTDEDELQQLLSAVTQAIAMEAAQVPSAAPSLADVPPVVPEIRVIEERPSADPAPATVPESIQDVDAQVAAQAEEAMATDQPAAAVAEMEPEVAAPTEEVIAAAPEPEPVRQPAHAPDSEPEHHRKEVPGREQPDTKVHIPPKPPGKFRTHVEAPLLRAVGLVSRPLASKPAMIQAAGLVAVNTLALAAGLWVYTLYFRPAHVAPADHQTFDFAHSGLPQPKHDPGGHEAHATESGSHGDGHGAPKKDDGHGAKKDDGHGGHDGGGHGDDGHGGTAKPAEPKKSIIPSSGTKYLVNEKLIRRPGEGKPKEASGGHGGGH